MSYYQFSRKDLKKVVDTELFLLCESEFTRLWPKQIPAARNILGHDRYDYQYWSYVGCCERVAILITYPMIRLLYPNLKLKLLIGYGHAAIVTDNFSFDYIPVAEKSRNLTQPLIFDMIALTLGCSREWIFYKINDEGYLVDEKDIAEWYTNEVFDGVYDQSCDLICDVCEM